MNIEVTNFYRTHLPLRNISNRLISLCVSDTLSIDNGLWLASHVSTFISLQHLSLIDIRRSSFESILNSLSPMNSLTIFSIRFSSEYRAVYSYTGLPEGVYYERIFHLFPSLHVCHLGFWRYNGCILDSQFPLPPARSFIPIQSSLLHLKSLIIQHCSSNFLSHLFEHLPQLEQLTFKQTDPWLPATHPLSYNNDRVVPINKHRAPNLCHLSMDCREYVDTVESITELFEQDVLFSLMKFRFSANIAGPYVISSLISMLCGQCVYSFNVYWAVRGRVSLPEASNILSNTFQQLKASVPVELTLALQENMYYITAVTVPRMDRFLCVYSYLRKNVVHGRSRWPSYGRVFNSQLLRCNKITMSKNYDQINHDFLHLSPPIIPWQQITSIKIAQPFNSTHLHLLFSQTTNLRTLELKYRSKIDSLIDMKEENLIDLLDDVFLCNMLMSIGLRQLNIITPWDRLDIFEIVYSIVKRLPHLQVLQIDSFADQLGEISHILINGLPKLNFLTIIGCCNCAETYDKKLRDLQTSNTRSFRTEVSNTIDKGTLYVWL